MNSVMVPKSVLRRRLRLKLEAEGWQLEEFGIEGAQLWCIAKQHGRSVSATGPLKLDYYWSLDNLVRQVMGAEE